VEQAAEGKAGADAWSRAGFAFARARPAARERGGAILAASMKAVAYAAIGFVVFQAFVLKVSFWDSYDYLNDAVALGGAPAAYYRVHAPLVPIALCPIVRVLWSMPTHDTLHLLLPRLAVCALSIGAALATFLYTRRLGGTLAAAAALFFFVTSRVFLHYGPHILVDLPLAGWTMVALGRVLAIQEENRARDYVLLGLALAGACLTKYSVALLPVVCTLGLVAIAFFTRSKARWRVLAGSTIALVIAASSIVLVLVWVAARIGETPWRYASELVAELRDTARVELGHESPLDYAGMLPVVVSPIVLALAAIGAVVSLRREPKRSILPLVWALVFAISLLAGTRHTEVRYLAPLLPLLCAFAGVAVARAWQWIEAHRVRARRAGAFALAAVLGVALLPGVDQIARDASGFYRTDNTGALVEWLRARNAPGEVLTSGAPLALIPPVEPLLRDDEFYDVYTLGHPAFRYHLARSARRGNELPSTANPEVTQISTQKNALTSRRIADGDEPLEVVWLRHCVLCDERQKSCASTPFACDLALLDLRTGRVCAPVERCGELLVHEPRKTRRPKEGS
jgi:hypothetical protein